MKRIEISILKPSAALQAFAQTWQDAQVALGLLDQDPDGGLSAPYDEILIHADIRDAA